jgi:hypothetical protein
MDKPKFTPGPWRIGNHSCIVECGSKDDTPVSQNDINAALKESGGDMKKYPKVLQKNMKRKHKPARKGKLFNPGTPPQ